MAAAPPPTPSRPRCSGYWTGVRKPSSTTTGPPTRARAPEPASTTWARCRWPPGRTA
ncbi:hypothetical protein LV779_20180 [Streptomyces thinghirensis]|nr:hypothetical protein [Streptomyces thinghirensis]